MPILLILLFPVLEIFSIIRMSDRIGGWETFWLLLLIAFVGFRVISTGGFASWTNYQRDLQSGKQPSQAPIQGLLVFLGGILLVVPGFISDVVGILLIIPITQQLFVKKATNYFKKKIQSGHIKVFSNTTSYGEPQGPSRMKDVTPIKEHMRLD